MKERRRKRYSTAFEKSFAKLKPESFRSRARAASTTSGADVSRALSIFKRNNETDLCVTVDAIAKHHAQTP